MLDKQLYTLKEASEILSLSVNTLKKWRYDGKLKVVKLGRAIRVPKEELERMLKGE